MKSEWNDAEADAQKSDLALRCYTSRLLGRDRTLVLHGGGNTSVKVRRKNVLGDEEDILYVKGSGWDLETIEEAGFAPVRLAHLQRLARLPALSDPQMVNELATQMTRASAPAPSVEAILHAILPHKYVDHTHADAMLAITNTADGEARIREVYGDLVVVIPYVMPGFELAHLCAERFPAEAGPNTIGMVLMNHGMFSFGATAKESYERMIALVQRAEDYLRRKGAWDLSWPASPAGTQSVALDLARLRKAISEVAGFPMVMARHADARSLAFCRRGDLATIAQQGPATPDHAIRTKNMPMIGRDVAAYAQRYREYFAAHEPAANERKTMVDPAPRLVLDPELGCARWAGRRKRPRLSPRSISTRWRSSRVRRHWVATVRFRRRIFSTSNTGILNRRSCARAASRRCSPARSHSSPVRPPASARRVSTRCSPAVRALSASISIPASSRQGNVRTFSASYAM
jgi:rhamnose utilization protein RhaD (predicted bifunctional aldolase and dehydrogenase)